MMVSAKTDRQKLLWMPLVVGWADDITRHQQLATFPRYCISWVSGKVVMNFRAVACLAI